MDFFKGNKTYFIAIAIGVVTALHAAGIIETGTFQTIMGFLGSSGLITLRHAMPSNKRTP